MTNVVQTYASIQNALDPTRVHHPFALGTTLGRQWIEHAVPGPYPPGTFPSLTAAVQMRPALETFRFPVPVRAPRPMRLQRPMWAYSNETQAITPRIDMDFGAGWVDVSADVVSGIKAQWGIQATGPNDRVAEPGTLSFDMDDNGTNEGGLRGFYSPDNPDKREGWGLGTPVRLVLVHDVYGENVRWVGRVEHIGPRVGVASPTIAVSCADWMEEAALAPLSGLEVQTDIQSNFLFEALVDVVPTPPPGGVFVKLPGSDIYPYALDQTKDESGHIITELQKLAVSEYGIIYVEAGVAIFEGRCWRGVPRPPVYALDVDEQILDLPLTAHGRDQVTNRVQVTVHPRGSDAEPTAELFSLASALLVKAGATVTVQCQYRDPAQRAQRVGGVDMQRPTLALGDYRFTSDQAGVGTNLSRNLTVVATFGGNSAVVTLTNRGGTDGYLPAGGLRLVGRGLYDFAPITAEQRAQDSVDLYGENRFPFDQPLQPEPGVADDLSRWFLHLYRDPRTRAVSVQFLANWDEEALAVTMSLTVSDRITITAASAGLDAKEFFVNGIGLDIHQSGLTAVTLQLAECDPTAYWQLGVHGKSELGSTTRLGYRVFKPGWWLGRAGYSELGSTTKLKGEH